MQGLEVDRLDCLAAISKQKKISPSAFERFETDAAAAPLQARLGQKPVVV